MPLVARSHVTTLLIELWQCEQLKWHGDDWWQRLWSPTQNPFWDFLRSEKGLKHKDCSESWYEIVRMRERTTFSRACLPECRAAAWPRLAAGGTWTCLCKWPAFPHLPSPPCLNRYIVVLPCHAMPARTSFPPAMLYQCATVVLQCSCSSLPLQCSQFPVPCQPACVLNRINHTLPPHYNHTAVPGHFNPDRHSPRLALYQFEPV